MAQIERDRLEFVELFAKKKEAANHFASMSMGNEAEQEAAFNKILNEVSSVMHRFRDEDLEMKMDPKAGNDAPTTLVQWPAMEAYFRKEFVPI